MMIVVKSQLNLTHIKPLDPDRDYVTVDTFAHNAAQRCDRDQLTGLAHPHFHCDVEQVRIAMLHPELGHQHPDHLAARGARRHRQCLVLD